MRQLIVRAGTRFNQVRVILNMAFWNLNCGQHGAIRDHNREPRVLRDHEGELIRPSLR